MPGARCSPPKGQSVKAHTRSKSRKSAKATARARTAKLPYVVVNSRTGAVVSRHRTLTAAIREERRLDLISYRKGNGRPYDARKTA
jgi:hypothetical protein